MNGKSHSVLNIGSGHPVNATVSGDPNQDGNGLNDRLPAYGRNAYTGPDYATTDLRLTRKIRLAERYKLDLTAESSNLFSREQASHHYFKRSDRKRHELREKLYENRHYSLSGLLPATTKLHEAQRRLRPKADPTRAENGLLAGHDQQEVPAVLVTPKPVEDNSF
jgi:hypothetical protein